MMWRRAAQVGCEHNQSAYDARGGIRVDREEIAGCIAGVVARSNLAIKRYLGPSLQFCELASGRFRPPGGAGSIWFRLVQQGDS